MLLENLYLLDTPLVFSPQGFASPALYYGCVFAYVRARNASIITLFEPASAVVLAAITLSQPITSSVLVGGGLIVVVALVVSGAGAVGGLGINEVRAMAAIVLGAQARCHQA